MDNFKYHMLDLERTGIIIKNPECKIKYADRRGNEFEIEILAMHSDRKFAREDYYNHLMANRNWFQKLFNIKPSMKFYDKMDLRAFGAK